MERKKISKFKEYLEQIQYNESNQLKKGNAETKIAIKNEKNLTNKENSNYFKLDMVEKYLQKIGKPDKILEREADRAYKMNIKISSSIMEKVNKYIKQYPVLQKELKLK